MITNRAHIVALIAAQLLSQLSSNDDGDTVAYLERSQSTREYDRANAVTEAKKIVIAAEEAIG